MEIDKDKVVEAAKAYVEKQDVIYKHGGFSYRGCDEYFALREALNTPPPRPSKEECIDWLVKSCAGNADRVFQKAIMDYLGEPSLQWVKNTGVPPLCKACIVRYKDGHLKLREGMDCACSTLWLIKDIPANLQVKEYIIIN